MTRYRLLLICLCCILAACAKPPRQQLDAAEYVVARAYSLQAPNYAPVEYKAAQAALEDARQAMSRRDYGAAEDSLDFALQHGRRAIARAEEIKARQAAEAEAAARLQAEAARQAAEKQLAEQKARASEEQAKAKKLPPPVKPETPPPPALTYKVGEGETLWNIANHPEVYGDGLLWPLLYQANRDQIKDPRQIFPGQILNIRRDLTAEDIAQARQKARESDIFPVPPPPPASLPQTH